MGFRKRDNMDNDRDFDRMMDDGDGRRPRSNRARPSADLTFDYKDVDLLKRYLSEHAKITPARISRLNAKQQRQLTTAIKRAQQLAMLPIAPSHTNRD